MSNQLKMLRLKAGYTMQKLADLVGTTAPQINKLEKGQRDLDKKWATRLAPFLGVRPDELIFPETTALRQQAGRLTGLQDRPAPVFGPTTDKQGRYTLGAKHSIDKKPRTIQAMGEKGFFVTVVGDLMEPLFEEGQILAVNPDHPLTKGKPCVVETINNETLIRRFISRNSREIVCETLNPVRLEKYSMKEIRNIFRIVGQEF